MNTKLYGNHINIIRLPPENIPVHRLIVQNALYAHNNKAVYGVFFAIVRTDSERCHMHHFWTVMPVWHLDTHTLATVWIKKWTFSICILSWIQKKVLKNVMWMWCRQQTKTFHMMLLWNFCITRATDKCKINGQKMHIFVNIYVF